MKAAPTRRKGKAAPAGLRGVDLIARALAPSPESKDEFEQIGDFCEKFSRAVSKNVPEAKREACLRAALASAGAISSKEDRANAYATLAAYLPSGLTDAAYEDFRRRFPFPPNARAALNARWGYYYLPPLKTNSKGPVEKYEKPAYKPDMDGLNNYLKSQGVPESIQPELAAKIDRLVKAEITGREAVPAAAPSFAAALEAMTLKDRRAALIQHYGLVPDKDGKYGLPEEKKWATVRGENPTPEQFKDWLDSWCCNRREIGMVLSDLRHLDARAYEKLHNWSQDSKIEKGRIDALDLPTKTTKYDPARDANAAVSFAEIVTRAERGEDTFKNLSRSRVRAQYHARVG
jgi:hypothetical protein